MIYSIKNLLFRWDLNHLVNRAHLEGKVEGEEDETFDLDDADEPNEIEAKDKDCMVSELINYIQRRARKLKHGLSFAQLKMSQLVSLRAKSMEYY